MGTNKNGRLKTIQLPNQHYQYNRDSLRGAQSMTFTCFKKQAPAVVKIAMDLICLK